MLLAIHGRTKAPSVASVVVSMVHLEQLSSRGSLRLPKVMVLVPWK